METTPPAQGDGGQERLFIAIPAPAELISPSLSLKEANSTLAGTRWIPLVNLHITVCFLGDLPAGMSPQILRIMSNGLARTGDFELVFDRFSIEGGRRPSMVWARYHRHPAFTALAGWLHSETAAFTPALHRFHQPVPHVTLARIRSGPAPEIRCNDELPALPFRGFELWKTCRLPGGVRYEVLGSFYNNGPVSS
jgi:2'-5' RNA ligase